MKEQIDEPRPNGRGNDSCPSGHTSNAFAHAVFIHRRYSINQAILPYAMATFVGYSRIQSR
ncbi:MAG: phosphatase PAP2 family protein [Alphaproteobacteria bacterium]|nr:phosphatase PAP2 family protein [Alphaproteobacteria bacterium]